MRQIIVKIFVLLAVFAMTSCASRQPTVEAQFNQNSNLNNAAQTNKSDGLDNSAGVEKPNDGKVFIPITENDLSPKLRAFILQIAKNLPFAENERLKYLEQNPEIKYKEISLGGTNYILDIRTGKIIGKREYESDCCEEVQEFCGDYTEVYETLLNDKFEDINRESQFGVSQTLMKFDGKNWKEIATPSELFYKCKDLRSVPKKVRECLAIDCL